MRKKIPPPPPEDMENDKKDIKDKRSARSFGEFFHEYWKTIVVCVSVAALTLALVLTPLLTEDHESDPDDGFHDPTLIESTLSVKGEFVYDGYLGDSAPLSENEKLFKGSKIILNEDKSGKVLLKGEFLPKKVIKEDISYKVYKTESASHFLLVLTDGTNTTKLYYVIDENGDYLIYDNIEFRSVTESLSENA